MANLLLPEASSGRFPPAALENVYCINILINCGLVNLLFHFVNSSIGLAFRFPILDRFQNQVSVRGLRHV